MALLTIADGALKLGDKEIDGILKSIRAHGANEVWARAVAMGYSEKQADIIASEHLGHSRASITKEHYVRK